MTEPPNGVDAGAGPDPQKAPGLAPWQKVVGIIGLVVLLVVVIALLIGGGHTPPIQHSL